MRMYKILSGELLEKLERVGKIHVKIRKIKYLRSNHYSIRSLTIWVTKLSKK
jgi:hypothetical protein